MIKKVIGCVLFCGVLAACDVTTEDVPKQFKDQIITLRNESIAAQKKCQDLAREEQELNARIQWNNQRVQTVAQEALIATGHTGDGKYIVNTSTLKIERR